MDMNGTSNHVACYFSKRKKISDSWKVQQPKKSDGFTLKEGIRLCLYIRIKKELSSFDLGQ